MKALYITSSCTIIVLTLFGLLMSSIPAPLGGEPFSVVTLTDKKGVEEKLLKRKTAIKLAARKSKKAHRTRGQKNPIYFKSEVDSLSEIPLSALDSEDYKNNRLANLEKPKNKPTAGNELELLTITGLRPAPVPELIETTSFGDLPRISHDGKRPQDVYARPAHITPKSGENLKTIAILITGLGLSKPMTDNAIEKLPPEITLAYNPYSSGLKNLMRRSRQKGHELLLQMPMEPFDYPDNDPGPHTLLSNQTDKINLERMRWVLGRMAGYTGIVNEGGGRFTATEQAIHPVLRELKDRGLLYMDSNPQSTDAIFEISQDMKLDYLQNNLNIDEIKTTKSIDKALKELESIASTHGNAIGVATALPLTIQRLEKWSTNLKKRGYTLIPLTAAISRKQS